MKNPWKQHSKISPQLESGRGDRRLANDVYHALTMARLTGVQYQICLLIIEKTWGFLKISDTISAAQFVDVCGCSERQIWNSIKQLKELGLIHYEPSERVKRGSPLNEYVFNKYYDTWTVWKSLRIPLEHVLRSCGNLVNNSAERVKNITGKGEKYYQTSLKRISPFKRNKSKVYISKADDVEKFITEKLKGIATKDQVLKVYREIEPRNYWRVERFLNRNYSDRAHTSRLLDEVKRELKAEGEESVHARV